MTNSFGVIIVYPKSIIHGKTEPWWLPYGYTIPSLLHYLHMALLQPTQHPDDHDRILNSTSLCSSSASKMLCLPKAVQCPRKWVGASSLLHIPDIQDSPLSLSNMDAFWVCNDYLVRVPSSHTVLYLGPSKKSWTVYIFDSFSNPVLIRAIIFLSTILRMGLDPWPGA